MAQLHVRSFWLNGWGPARTRYDGQAFLDLQAGGTATVSRASGTTGGTPGMAVRVFHIKTGGAVLDLAAGGTALHGFDLRARQQAEDNLLLVGAL